MRHLAAIIGSLLATAAGAQSVNVGLNPSQLPSKADVAAAQTAANTALTAARAAQAAIPQPAASAPGAEMVGGSTGTDTRYALANHSHPRISRTGSCTLTASNACTITWTSPFPAGTTVVMVGDPSAINTGGVSPIDCDAVAQPTTAGVSVKCWPSQTTAINAALVTAGLTVAPFGTASLAGTQVQASAIPASN